MLPVIDSSTTTTEVHIRHDMITYTEAEQRQVSTNVVVDAPQVSVYGKFVEFPSGWNGHPNSAGVDEIVCRLFNEEVETMSENVQ